MKHFALIFLVAITGLSSFGCDRKPALAEEQANAGEEAMAIADDLKTNHDIDLYPKGDEFISTETWNNAFFRQLWVLSTAETRKTIRAKLLGFISRADRVLAIANYKTIRTPKATVTSWQAGRKNAQLYLDSLNEYEN